MALGGVVCVQRGKDKMAGQRRLRRDFCRFGVADRADHDHVRILAQEGAQHGGEVEINAGIDLALYHIGHRNLDGILDHGDVDPRRTDRVDCRIKSGRLARAVRTGDEHDAGGIFHQPAKRLPESAAICAGCRG